MKKARTKRVVVPGVSIWPQPKRNPRQRYRISYGPRGKVKTITASTDMESTVELAMQISRRRERQRLGLDAPDDDRRRQEADRKLTDHLADWRDALKHAGLSRKHVAQMHLYASTILLGTPPAAPGAKRRRGRETRVVLPQTLWDRIGDVVPSKVLAQVHRLRDLLTAATANRYMDAVNAFLNWGVGDERWPRNTCKHLDRFRVAGERKVRRRALSAAEFSQLVDAAHGGPVRERLDGPTRSLVYRTVCAAGLRADEARRLPRCDAILEGANPGLWVDAKIAKNRKRQFVPLPPSLAAELREHAAGRGPSQPLLDLPPGGNTARMVRADLEAAGIAYETEAGRFDFHGLRHECGALLISEMARRGNLNVKAVQQHMRHSSIRLTLDTYGHLLPEDRDAARDSLRSFTAAERTALARANENGDASRDEPGATNAAQPPPSPSREGPAAAGKPHAAGGVRPAQRKTGPKCRPMSPVVAGKEPRMSLTHEKTPENRGSVEWSHGESNPDLLNAIQPSLPQNSSPQRNIQPAPVKRCAPGAAPNPPKAPGRYVRTRGRVTLRVPRPLVTDTRAAERSYVQELLAAAERDRRQRAAR